MHVTKDFEELFGYLNAEGARYLIVGGHAVAFHAKPRYTKDVDILVDCTRENAGTVLRALAAFGFGDVGLSEEDFLKPGQVIQLGIAPNRVDILTSLVNVAFEEAWAGRVRGRYGFQDVFYIGKAELIRAKRGAARAQDLIDVDWLEGTKADDE